MALSLQSRNAEREPIDDYHVDRDAGQITRPASQHVVSVMKGVLLVILAAVSFALFWVVATLLGIG